jgi:ATP-dependent Clp protease ATP-binding subunit ClpB
MLTPALCQPCITSALLQVQVAQRYSHQVVETPHLLLALLEQPKGLARRILQAAGAEPSAVLSAVDSHLRSLPKVSGHSDQVLGRSLEALITAAEARQALMKDSYTSVEHLVLAADGDPHFGETLFRRFNMSHDKLEKAIKDIRGSKHVEGMLLR